MKGIILAAGYGSRFLPITKTIPKEMLPIVNLPAIHFIVEEFLEAGIKDLLVISHRNKKSLEDYFDRIPELESYFERSGKKESMNIIKPYEMNVAFIRQKEMKGPGDALLLAKPFIGNEPFVVAFPDDLIIQTQKGLTSQLIETYEKFNKNVLSIMNIEGDVSRYGVVKPGIMIDQKHFEVIDMVEKPEKGKEPSKSISIGRYLFQPELMEVLSELRKTHTGGEFYLTSGIQKLAKENKVMGCLFEGKRLDTGEPKGYIEAIIEYLKNHEEYNEIFSKIINK